MNLEAGQLDYCLPLLLPPTIDEVFGKTGREKDMVEKAEAPTLKL